MLAKVKSLSRVQLFVTPWTVAYQASPSKGFSRQEYWSGLPFPSPGDLPDPGVEPRSALQANTLPAEPPSFLFFNPAFIRKAPCGHDAFLIYCLVRFAKFLFRIYVCMFIRDIGLSI